MAAAGGSSPLRADAASSAAPAAGTSSQRPAAALGTISTECQCPPDMQIGWSSCSAAAPHEALEAPAAFARTCSEEPELSAAAQQPTAWFDLTDGASSEPPDASEEADTADVFELLGNWPGPDVSSADDPRRGPRPWPRAPALRTPAAACTSCWCQIVRL